MSREVVPVERTSDPVVAALALKAALRLVTSVADMTCRNAAVDVAEECAATPEQHDAASGLLQLLLGWDASTQQDKGRFLAHLTEKGVVKAGARGRAA